MKAGRGVVLVYVLILITISAYLSSMLLNATFSRRISSEVTMGSAQAQSDMVAAESIMTSCFAANSWPPGITCAAPPGGCLSGSLPADTGIPARPYAGAVCAGNPPCRIRINVCRPREGDEPTATCPAPGC